MTPRDMLAKLVGFDTTSAKSNMALIDYAATHLEACGARVAVLPGRDGAKANLFATFGPEGDDGICLSGHTDVVPVAGQSWSSDPFRLVERGGRLYGRGAADMKGFIATALALAPEMSRRSLQRPIHFAFSHDEEVGCLGAPAMIERFGAALPRPGLVIVGEPTEMRVVNAHKGIVALTTTVTGVEAHSSRPHEAVNAIGAAARIVGFLDRLGGELAHRRDDDYDPPYTTVNVGLIEGGNAINIVPRRCVVHWEFRPVPGIAIDEVVARVRDFAATEVLPPLRAVDRRAAIDTEIAVVVPPLAPQPGSAAEALALALTGANRATSVAFTSEAGQFQAAGIPAVLCGPGAIAQAHQPDEYVSLDQLDQCEGFLRRLLDRAAA